MSNLSRLEQYTLKRRQEVLLVTANINGKADQVVIFRGFSSSLVRSTAFDPDVPILPDDATIVRIDRLLGPYDPGNPQYLQQNMDWEAVQSLLVEAGV